MALGEDASCSDRDLKELRDCLRLIVSNLLACVRDENSLPSTVTRHKLREISNSFPDIWRYFSGSLGNDFSPEKNKLCKNEDIMVMKCSSYLLC